jgi:hypothetical protein
MVRKDLNMNYKLFDKYQKAYATISTTNKCVSTTASLSIASGRHVQPQPMKLTEGAQHRKEHSTATFKATSAVRAQW